MKPMTPQEGIKVLQDQLSDVVKKEKNAYIKEMMLSFIVAGKNNKKPKSH